METIAIYGPSRPRPVTRSAPLRRSKSVTELSIEAEIAIAAVNKALGQPSETFTRSRQIIGHKTSCTCEDCMAFKYGWGRDERFGARGF
ncbi:hypothetical protein [Mycobacterium sp. 3-98]|uniref:hypothetical protein n=1 Tax=Mycobacterium sp. 3-98 TaxID=3042317 RepID=UPI002DDC0D50|nr:hypothetical protein [Mycobacterium sp. 3-98]WSE46439.1 hypothetical protein QGN30_00215 [Mycobacterium sp. 3-98]